MEAQAWQPRGRAANCNPDLTALSAPGISHVPNSRRNPQKPAASCRQWARSQRVFCGCFVFSIEAVCNGAFCRHFARNPMDISLAAFGVNRPPLFSKPGHIFGGSRPGQAQSRDILKGKRREASYGLRGSEGGAGRSLRRNAKTLPAGRVRRVRKYPAVTAVQGATVTSPKLPTTVCTISAATCL